MTVRKYVEMCFTLPHEATTIMVGLHRNEAKKDQPVHLFTNEGGILASVSVEGTSLDLVAALDMAEDLAFEEIDRFIPGDLTIPAPWRVLIVDHDGMAEDLRNSKVQDWDAEAMRPEKPISDEDGGEPALVKTDA